jgi:hypothetical protein
MSKVFSGTIISSVIPNGDIKRTAEWQLLLAAIALPGTYSLLAYCSRSIPFFVGVFIGAALCNPFGRRNTVRPIQFILLLRQTQGSQMMLGFSGYLIFGLIIG